MQARIQARDYPDILNDNAFAGAATEGLLYPIDEVMSPATLASIEPALLKNGVGSDGKQWAAPDIASSRMLAYNTDLFQKAGIAEPPKTWAELEDAAKKIRALGGDTYGYGLPLGQEEAQVESSLWLWGAGGDWPQGDKLVANQPAAVEAFAEMKKLIDAGVTQPNPGATNRQQAADLFNNGKLGMMLSHSGLLKVTRENFPQTKFAVAPIPSKGGTPVAFGVTDFIVAFNNQDANRKEATKQFLDLMYSDEFYETWYKGTGLLPVTKSMIEKGRAEDTANADFYQALTCVKFLPVGNPKWDALQKALQGTAGTIANDTPESVLTKVQAQLDAQGCPHVRPTSRGSTHEAHRLRHPRESEGTALARPDARSRRGRRGLSGRPDGVDRVPEVQLLRLRARTGRAGQFQRARGRFHLPDRPDGPDLAQHRRLGGGRRRDHPGALAAARAVPQPQLPWPQAASSRDHPAVGVVGRHDDDRTYTILAGLHPSRTRSWRPPTSTAPMGCSATGRSSSRCCGRPLRWRP